MDLPPPIAPAPLLKRGIPQVGCTTLHDLDASHLKIEVRIIHILGASIETDAKIGYGQ
jgi:hypothetical protein